MKIIDAWRKMKYYKDVVSFPSEELGALSWWQRRKIKKMILFGLPYYYDDGTPLFWKVEFYFGIKRDIYSRKLLEKLCTGISVRDSQYDLIYNIEKGSIRSRYYSDPYSDPWWDVEIAIKEWEKKNEIK